MDYMRWSCKKNRLNWEKQERLIEHIVAGTMILTGARLIGIHCNAAAYSFLRLRELTVYELKSESETCWMGGIKAIENYYNGKHKGSRWGGRKSTLFSEC